jgi:hypothetical protein
MCVDKRFQSTFENNIYADINNFNFLTDSAQFFEWKFKEGVGSLQDCTGILVYSSTFTFLEDLWTRQRIGSVRPITDIPTAKYGLLITK